MTTKKKAADPQHQNIREAFAAAQAQFPAIHKDKEVAFGRTQFRYASLDAIYAGTRPVLNAHGLSVTHRLEPADTALLVVTEVLWTGGDESLESTIPVDLGLPMKELGASITYAKRYGLASLLGIAADEDIDAKGLEQRGGQQHRAPATGRTIRNMRSSKRQPPLSVSIRETTVKAIRDAKDLHGLNNALMAINALPEPERAQYRTLMLDASRKLDAEYSASRGAYVPVGGEQEEAN